MSASLPAINYGKTLGLLLERIAMLFNSFDWNLLEGLAKEFLLNSILRLRFCFNYEHVRPLEFLIVKTKIIKHLEEGGDQFEPCVSLDDPRSKIQSLNSKITIQTFDSKGT